MKKQIILLVLLLNLSGVFYSCLSKACEDEKFFIYEGIDTIITDAVINEGDSLSIQIVYLQPDFTASVIDALAPSNILHAQIDCDKGWGGDKFPLISISIKSNVDFSESLPSGTALNELFKSRGQDLNGETQYAQISEFDPANLNTSYLYLTQRPSVDKAHKFIIEFEKSNGEKVSTETQTITWQ